MRLIGNEYWGSEGNQTGSGCWCQATSAAPWMNRTETGSCRKGLSQMTWSDSLLLQIRSPSWPTMAGCLVRGPAAQTRARRILHFVLASSLTSCHPLPPSPPSPPQLQHPFSLHLLLFLPSIFCSSLAFLISLSSFPHLFSFPSLFHSLFLSSFLCCILALSPLCHTIPFNNQMLIALFRNHRPVNSLGGGAY